MSNNNTEVNTENTFICGICRHKEVGADEKLMEKWTPEVYIIDGSVEVECIHIVCPTCTCGCHTDVDAEIEVMQFDLYQRLLNSCNNNYNETQIKIIDILCSQNPLEKYEFKVKGLYDTMEWSRISHDQLGELLKIMV